MLRCVGRARRLNATSTPLRSSSPFFYYYNQRNLSSTPNNSKDEESPPPPQSFVKERFEPGQWDVKFKDPLHRPPWKNVALTISQEDFANRPRAVQHTEFASIHDTGVVLSWLTQDQRDGIYDSYIKLMESSHKECNGITSHEYVIKVIAQNYNITKERAAAIVQLIHNQERYKLHQPERIHDMQPMVDKIVFQNIKDAYREYDEMNPQEFVEEPVLGTYEPSRETVTVSDLHDLKDMIRKTAERDREEAQLILDRKRYVEDVDDSERKVKIDGQCEKLIEMHSDGFYPEAASPKPSKWKFVAKIIDTTKMKQIRNGKERHRRLHSVNNIIVEENGTLRAATVEEVKNTAWKPKRNPQEFTYGEVKRAWMEKVLKGKHDGWGRANV